MGTKAGILTRDWKCQASRPGLSPQGFTYVAPSVLDSSKEGFSFQPKLRSPRRLNSSPRTPIRYSGAGQACGWGGALEHRPVLLGYFGQAPL